MLSDHAFITFTLNVNKPRVERFWTTSRSWRKFSRSAFEADLKVSQLCTDLHVLQDSLVELYDTSMLTLLDKHCPAVKIQRRFGPLTPWFDADCRESRRQSRMLERRYRRTGADADRLVWIKQLKTMYAVYEQKGHQHWRTRIADSRENTKMLWHTMRGILGKTKAANGMTVTVQRTLPSSLQTKLTPSAHQPTSPPQAIADTASGL